MKQNKNNPEKRIPGQGHRMRMRLRFSETFSLRNFTEEEALEMALFYALPKQDTTDAAKALLAKFGKLSSVLDAPVEALTSVPGIGEYTAVYFKFIKAFLTKYQNSKNETTFEINDIAQVGKFCSDLIGNEDKEVCMVIVADASRHILGYKILHAGNTDSLAVDIRQLMTFILQSDSRFVVIAHNHPGGVLLPSAEDQHFTSTLQQMLHPYGIGLIDHFIVYNDKFFSFTQRNLL